MAFGAIRAKRKAKKYKREAEEARRQSSEAAKANPEQDRQSYQAEINRIAEEQRQKERTTREEGRKYAEEVLQREYPGLNEGQRRNLQEEANYQISRDIQGYQQKLSGQQGMRGVRGGAAFAQQQELARLGSDAQTQIQRDLSKLDSELALKKAAAAYNIEQGEVGQEQLRHQQAIDILNSYDQRKYQKMLADQARGIFQRV